MNLQKNKPFRSKEFMSFLHSRRDLVGDECALCTHTWSQLHHFGNDGGTSLKPSDLYLVKLCHGHAVEHEIKMRSLICSGRWELLSHFLEDSMHNAETWLKWRQENKRLPERKR